MSDRSTSSELFKSIVMWRCLRLPVTYRFDVVVAGEDYGVIEDAYVEVDDDGLITSVGRGSGGLKIGGIAVPGLINAHVHTGDYALAGLGLKGKLEDVVAPPLGLKHRELARMGEDEVIASIAQATLHMLRSGTVVAGDFREGGTGGVKAARSAAMSTGFKLVVLGRPLGEDDVEDVLSYADGIGLSSPLEFPPGIISRAHSIAKSNGKLLAAHVAETRDARDAGDLELLLENAEPSFIVHGTNLTQDDLSLLAERGIPLVVCPRSNSFFGVGEPPLAEALRDGVDVALGTDNTGWISPELEREMEAAFSLLRRQDERMAEPRLVLRAAALGGARALSLKKTGIIKEGWMAHITIFEKTTAITASRDLLASLVLRAGSKDVKAMMVQGKLLMP